MGKVTALAEERKFRVGTTQSSYGERAGEVSEVQVR